MKRQKFALETIEDFGIGYAIFDFAKGDPYSSIPSFDEADLVCGSCGHVLMSGWTPDTARVALSAQTQVLAICPECRAHNLIPVTIKA